MIPDFLKEYQSDLEKFKLDYVQITATSINSNETLPLTQSKFLGKPYLPLNMEYPLDNNGKPMLMLSQINFSEVPQLENYPSHGILQLFVSSTDWYDMEDYKILFHKDITQNSHNDFSFLTEDLFEESPITGEHKLSFLKKTEYGGTEDCRFNYLFNGKPTYEFESSLSKEQKEQFNQLVCNAGHKIGGYAYFTQSDPRDYDSKSKNDVLLLQIDTDKNIMFGDSGVANVFINVDDLKNLNFENAYFNWDCC